MDGEALDQRIWADLDLAVRAVAVLVENALSFSPGDAVVEVGVGRRGSELAIWVGDRGPGIGPEQADHIFDAFTQADASTTRAHEGLGIGLFLAQRIMQAHGGAIEASSRPEGGSVFSLSFPAFEEQRTGAAG